MTLLQGQSPLLISVALFLFGVWWLIPKPKPGNKIIGLSCVLLGIIGQLSLLGIPGNPLVNEILFWLFSGSTLLFGALMVTHHKPVYAALWFALATLSACGLLLMQSAPFLAAATIIVYAGAIVVTFVFVIMLAQQAGATTYDQHSRRPGLAVIAAFVLVGAIMTVLHQTDVAAVAGEPAVADIAVDTAPEEEVTVFNSLSRPCAGEELGTLHGLGRALFGDYLHFVELAGVLLMIASIGAIAIAPRRGQGTL
ncbi:MAG TPA: NADH-quinone oxidoreductase subunit J [Planctomicrobium sp.]|nr:NADH-quinone oxidoreductase subunit J [Planctomicrobium sp.]